VPEAAPSPGPALPAAWRAACLVLAALLVFDLLYLGAQPFVVYGGLTALLWLGAGGRMTFTVIAAVVAVAGLEELRKYGIDFAVDAVAGFAAGAVMLLYARRKSRMEPVCAE
jgi:hypothetical protein